MAEPWLIRFFACNREMQPSSFFFVIRCGAGAGGSGSGSLTLTVPLGSGRVGSGQTISGTGRVRASVLSPCRTLTYSDTIIESPPTGNDVTCLSVCLSCSVLVVSNLTSESWMDSVQSADLVLNQREPCFSSAGHVRGNGHTMLQPPTPACCRNVRSVLPFSVSNRSVTRKAQWMNARTLGLVRDARPC